MSTTREHVNTTEIVGRLGQAPELKRTEDGTPYLPLSIATSESYTDRAGEIRQRTEWHRATAWGPVAEQIAAANLDKGDSVAISGSIRINSYIANDVRHRVSEIEIAGAKKNLDNVSARNDTRLVGVVREGPKTKQLENGTTLTTISLATRTTLNGKEREDWHSVTAWGAIGDAAARDIKAGDTIAINGVLRHRSVPGENGTERKLSAIETARFQVLERAQERTQEVPQRRANEREAPAAEQTKQRARQRGKNVERGM